MALSTLCGFRDALALGQDVPDAGRLEHRAHRAAGDDARSFGGGLEEHPAGAEVTEHLVGDGVALQRDAEEVLLGVLAALADRLGDLVGLAQADADVTGAIADHHQRREAEPPAALHHLGHAVDVDHAIAEIEVVGIDRSRHSLRLS